MLTGELPLGRFQAPSAKAALDARVDEIVFRALAKERELRQQSAGQVKDEVEGLASPQRGPQRPKIRVGWKALLVGAVLVLVLAWLQTSVDFGRRVIRGDRVGYLFVLVWVVLVGWLFRHGGKAGPGWRRVTVWVVGVHETRLPTRT